MSPRILPSRSPRRSALCTDLADLHRSALPRVEQIPEAFDLAFWARPARAIGGDILAAWSIGETRLMVCLADVMGHGIPAAIVASAVRAGLYQMELDQLDQPAMVLDGLNRLVRGMFEGYFVTASVCLLDTSGWLTHAQAGHPALLLRGLDGEITLLSTPSLPLGLDAEESYLENSHPLESGTGVLLYSDGVTDALANLGMPGIPALSTIVSGCRRPGSFRLVQRIRRAVHRSAPVRHDDRTALAVRVLPG